MSRAGRIGLLCLLLALTAAVFHRNLFGGFVYDDFYIVLRNPQIRHGLANLTELFSGSYWDFLDPETAKRVGYWRPLSGVVLSIGHSLGHGAPLPFHALSLAGHLAATALAYAYVLTISRDARVAFFAAALFSLHPVHVESVAWISAIHDPMYASFGLLALILFVRWRERGSRGVPLGASLAFLVALLFKEAAVVVLPLALVTDVGRVRSGEAPEKWADRARPFVRAYAPLAAAFVVYSLARMVVFHDWRAGFDRTTTDFGVSAARMLAFRVELLGGFLELAAWPRHLVLFRPFRPVISYGSLAIALAWCAGALGLGVLLYRRRAALPLAALAFLVVCVLPVVISVRSVGTFPLSDRFLYLGVLGFTLLASYLVLRIPNNVALAVLVVWLAAYGALSWKRQAVWRTDEALFRQCVAESPESPNVHWGLGRILLERYRVEKDPAVLDEALQSFQTGLDLVELSRTDGRIFATSDDALQSNLGLGWSLLFEAKIDEFHDFDTPIAVFNTLAQSYPKSWHVQTALGAAYFNKGDLAKAEEAFLAALVLDSEYPEAVFNLGILYMRTGEYEKAREQFEQDLAIRAEHLEGYVWLVNALDALGRTEDARRITERARALYPEAPEPLLLTGLLSAQSGDLAEAKTWFERALRVDPRYGRAHLERGKVLIQLEDDVSAIESLERACELLPDSYEAHYNTGAMLLQNGRPEFAVPYLVRAYALRPPGPRGEYPARALEVLVEGTPQLAVELAQLDLAAGRPDAALAWAERALDQDPDDGGALTAKGRALARKDPAAAIDVLRRACQRDPESFEAHHELGRLLLASKRGAEALPYLERALELAPKTGRRPELVEALRRSIENMIAVAKED